jgi:hypothetical protein
MISMTISRRSLALGFAALLSAPMLAHAAEPLTAKSFVEGIYQRYVGDAAKNAPGVILDKPADYRRYFTSTLVTIILKDQAAAAKRDEVPTLDGDPFIGHQDWEIANLTVDAQEDGDKASATVSFTNVGQPEKVAVSLRKVGKEWRIDDVTYADASTLRGLFKK